MNRRWKSASAAELVIRRAQEDRQAADEAEDGADDEGGRRAAGEGGEHDHQVDGAGLDVGRHASADLPAEPGAVDPRPELVEPALIDLAVMDRGDGNLRSERRRRAW